MNAFVEEKPKENILYSGVIQAFDSSIKLHKNIEGYYDAFSTYYINIDGSGDKITAWGQRVYPAGTFSDVYKQAEEIYNTTKSRSYTVKDTEMLISIVEERIKELSKKEG